jgi:Mrp family chromosome partitioning ATPase
MFRWITAFVMNKRIETGDEKMSNECDKSKCASCSSNCSGKKDLHEPCNSHSTIRKIISVVSGKGGVGKSMVTSSLAVALNKKGYRVGILDADITGPSIPKVFGVESKAMGTEMGMFPSYTNEGISIMSVNLLLEDEDAPVVWRGPMIAGAVKQFWTDVVWSDLDVLLIDMPPGTGDVPLTVFQTIPLDGAIVVTTPQDLVSLIVKKSYHMAEKMNIPILGIVENMSYMECPDCGKKLYPFGQSKLDQVAEEMGLDILARLPIQPENAELCDAGKIEKRDVSILEDMVQKVIQKLEL